MNPGELAYWTGTGSIIAAVIALLLGYPTLAVSSSITGVSFLALAKNPEYTEKLLPPTSEKHETGVKHGN